MAFDLRGPRRHVEIADEDEQILALPARFGLQCPQFDRIEREFYRSFEIDLGCTRGFLGDLTELRSRYSSALEPSLRRGKKVHSRHREVEAEVIARLLAADPVYRKLSQLIALCEEALACGQAIRCDGD